MNNQSRRFLHSTETEIQVSNFTFILYMLYIISFFLRFAARIPAIAPLRPDLLIAACLIIILVAQHEKLTGRFNNACNRYLLIFIAYIIFTLPFVEWPGSVLRGNLTVFIKAFLFFYFTVLIVDTDWRLKCFVFIFMACQLFRVLEPLYLHVAYGYWGSNTHLGMGEFASRLSGAPSDVINPNGLGLVIATLFPFLHYLWGSSRWTFKLAYISLVPSLLYALVLTMSRSGLIAMMVIVWNIFVKSRHKFIILMGVLVLISFAWSNLSDVHKDRYMSLTGADDVNSAASFQGRISGYSKEFAIALHKPLVGHGLGTSLEANVNVAGGRHISHNLYLETLIETGVIGLAIFILFIKSIYDNLRLIAKNQSEPTESKLDKSDKKPGDYYKSAPVSQPLDYEKNLLKALVTCFWMYVIYSFATYGLSEYNWYLLAGLAIVLNRRTLNKREINTSG